MPWIGSMFAPADAVSSRLDICNNCPELTTIKLCRNCGCVIPAKVRLKGSECPLGKWGKLVDDGQQLFVDDDEWQKQEQAVEEVRSNFAIKPPFRN